MSGIDPHGPRAAPFLPRPVLATIAAGVMIAGVALWLRVGSLDRAIAIDETRWLERSRRFADAVADARFGDTIQSGHPGVPTMWIAGFAQRTLPADATLRDRYARARLGLVVAEVALIVLVWWLARSVVGAVAAWLGALLLATDPFLVAHNRVVHLDGILALAMLASFLSLLRGSESGSKRALALSGVLAGIAVLTKPHAALLVIAAVLLLRRGGTWSLRYWWLAPAVLVAVAAWPALWTHPWEAIRAVAVGAGGAASETPGGKLLVGGRVVESLLFYPVSFLWRTTPVTLAGLVFVAPWAVRRRRDEGRRAAQLLVYAAALAVVVAVALKRQDRYLLPAMVAVDLAVAVYIARLAPRRLALAAVAVVMVAVHGWTAIALSPYQLAHYNWMVGGPVTARHVLAIGWGEGLDEAATELNRLPGAKQLRVAVLGDILFKDFFVGRTVVLAESALLKPGGEPVDLVLFYISSVQTNRYGTLWKRYEPREPLYTLTVNGLPYVRVYRVVGGDTLTGSVS